jgi:hypothetical protein
VVEAEEQLSRADALARTVVDGLPITAPERAGSILLGHRDKTVRILQLLVLLYGGREGQDVRQGLG